jgi:hypothetical protein
MSYEVSGDLFGLLMALIVTAFFVAWAIVMARREHHDAENSAEKTTQVDELAGRAKRKAS